MSTKEIHLETEKALLEDKEVLLRKLSTVFDPDIAADFINPKTYETRKHLTIEDLLNANHDEPDVRLQRLRSMVHYETTTQSLPRADLEASYQAFVRNQMGQQQCSRNELEQFVRNNSDIDAAQLYLDSAQNASLYPLESHLLFHSSKLNEQRANLLKSASTKKSLKDINDGFTLHEYFPETWTAPSKSAQKKRDHVDHRSHYSHAPSIHLEHRDKKYRVTFLKNSNEIQCPPKLSRYTANNRSLLLPNPRRTGSLFGTESSIVHGFSTDLDSSNIHREIFPPLSLAALREYRPTLIPNTSTPYPQSQQSNRKSMQKTEFIWEDSIVSPKT